jgi:tetratricopeptide (TPR) repeat protein
MAIVYLAEDVKHHRPVAIKVLQPELAAALGPERFLREIDVTARLNHPHILPLLDSGEAAGLLYYVMPYVEGESLRERLTQEKQLPLEEALRIAAEVADALSFAHGHDVLHRDIKPENILLEGGHAVVADFGLARAIHAAGGTRLTETGLAVGTPEYMSPEQAAGERELDARSDVYSLGCVLYAMLAGEPPFTSPTIETIARQHLTANPPDVTTLRAAVPVQVSHHILTALAKAPADRFSSAAELGEAITPSSGITSWPLVGTARTTRRRRVMVGGAVVLVAAIAVVATGLLMPRGGTGGLDPDRVLVVAFTDETGLPQTRALGRMVQDYIIQTLTEAGFAEVVDPLTALAVSQNVSAAGIAAGPGNVLALANEARAGTVVSGSYYAVGDSVHIQTRVSDARDGRLLGSVPPIVGAVDTPNGMVVRLGQQAVAALASLLEHELGPFEPAVQPAAYGAYETYNEGLAAYLRRDMAEAAGHFERAASADPTFARVRLWAAQTRFLLTISPDGWSHHAKAESLIAPLVESREQLSRFERCRLDFVIALGQWSDAAALYDAARCMLQAAPGSDDAKRELSQMAGALNRPGEQVDLLRELDPDRGLMRLWDEYWEHLSWGYYRLGDHQASLDAARQGIERFPENLTLLSHEAIASTALGRLGDATAAVDAMRSQSSLEVFGWTLYRTAYWLPAHGYHAWAHELFDEAIRWYESRVPHNQALRRDLAEVLYQAERWEDALQLYEELAEEYPEEPTYLAALGKLAARRGEREEALRISEELRSPRYIPVQALRVMRERAIIAALLGERQEAMNLLRVVEQGWYIGAPAHSDIDADSLRDYPPYQELMRPRG